MEQINQPKGVHDELLTVTEPEELRDGPHEIGSEASQPFENDPYDPDDDPFFWIDAAEWSPWQDEDDKDPENIHAALDESLGDLVTTGWYGLRRHVDQPGGVIVSQNPCGKRGLWSIDSDEALDEEWRGILREHQAFVLATRRPDAEGDVANPTPEVLIGTLRTSESDHFHGAWLNATVGADDLDHAVQFILRNSCHPTDEWAVFDQRGFPDQLNRVLDESCDASTISKVASGIAEHGPAFAAWVAHVHLDDPEALDRFSRAYQGEFESAEAYAARLLQDAEGSELTKKALASLRSSAQPDAEAYARQLAPRLHLVEAPNGNVWVFDPQR